VGAGACARCRLCRPIKLNFGNGGPICILHKTLKGASQGDIIQILDQPLGRNKNCKKTSWGLQNKVIWYSAELVCISRF